MAAHDEYKAFWKRCARGFDEMYAHVKPAPPGEVAEIGHRLPNGTTTEAYPGEMAFIRDTMAALLSEDVGVFYFDDNTLSMDIVKSPLFETANDFYAGGILKAPFPSSLFIFRHEVGTSVAFLQQIEGGFKVISFLDDDEMERGNKYSVAPAAAFDFLHSNCVPFADGLFKESVHAQALFAPSGLTNVGMRLALGKAAVLALTGCMMLSLPHYEREEIPIAEALQKSRAKHGKPPLRGYTVVRLKKAIRDAMGDGNGGWKVKPHWRRGHIRRLANGKVVTVQPCMVNWAGDKDLAKNVYRVAGEL